MAWLEIAGCSILLVAVFREWFWQLDASGLGPDHFFVARFEPGVASHLLPVVRQFMPMGFVPESDFLADLQTNGGHRFVDQQTFGTLRTMRESGAVSNIYISSSIEVRDETLTLENTYSRHEAGETAFLITVFQSERLSIQTWRVFAGGGGFDSTEVARGEDTVSFLKYLKIENQ